MTYTETNTNTNTNTDTNTNTNTNTNTDTNTDTDTEPCVYNPDQCKILLASSSIFLGTTVYTIFQKKYSLLAVPFGTFLTSINYWKKPKMKSWQRTLDVFYIYTSFGYQAIRSYGAQRGMYFYSGLCACFLFYKLSDYMYGKKRTWYSALLHSGIHITANFAILGVNSAHIDSIVDNKLIRMVADIVNFQLNKLIT